MSKMSKIFTICCILIIFFLGFFPFASSGKGEIDVKFQGEIMSAELQRVSLRLILEKLSRERGIWSKGDESVLEEKVSIRFEDLPLQEGLRRILSDFNYVLVFDRDKGLVGLFILDKRGPGRPVARDAVVDTGKALPSRPLGEATIRRNPFEIFPDMPPPGSPKAKWTDTMPGKDSLPPEDPNTERSNTGFARGSPSPEDAFDPFAENMFSPAENPFEGTISPGSEDPFSDSF